jgi:hypothetical protein
MAKFDEFINALHAQTGLNVDVIRAWVGMEQGVNNNVLGLTSGSPSKLMTFSSQTAAATATANALKSSNYYTGIINSVGKNSAVQALAIAQSPWHLGPGGLAKAGGTDPYYFKGFVRTGLISGGTVVGGQPVPTPVSTTPTPTSSTSTTHSNTNVLNTPWGTLDFAAPFYYIGIIGLALVLILVGGIITLKGKVSMPTVIPIPV